MSTKVKITLENGLSMLLELYPDVAPLTVENFLKLVDEGFYNGLTFHRVIADFMMQGGCPKGDGTGGPAHTIKGEFADNGHKNPLQHKRGVISMARTSDPNSAGSQFFIMHRDNAQLDGKYAAFGKVIEGEEVIDQVCKNMVNYLDQPINPVIIDRIERAE
ncbi:MAG: peptidylprolyl isomerase [Clostridiales bacterium]|nr:peptidylprolyl isomerase [Clostridiales bacterium]